MEPDFDFAQSSIEGGDNVLWSRASTSVSPLLRGVNNIQIEDFDFGQSSIWL